MKAKRFPLEPIEKTSRKKLAALQLERLKGSLSTPTRTSPRIARSLTPAGVKPKDLKTLADLAKFPFTAKRPAQNYPFGMFAVPMDRIVRIHASSGTTGKPTSSATPRKTSPPGRT